jgi:hypothetical protein
MIVGINGYAGSGKDTVGTIIQYLKCDNVGSVTLEEIIKDIHNHGWWLAEQSGWEVKKFAGKLKQIASILIGIPVEWFENQDFKKTHLGPEWDTWGILRKNGRRQMYIQDKPHDPDSVWLKDLGCTQVHNRMTVREFLQKLGTDGLRDGLHSNTWVNALMADYRSSPTDKVDCDNWIITDTRFSNEAKAIKDNGGIVIRVNRPGVEAINAHPSETGLDNWNFDMVIENDGTLEDLVWKVRDLIYKYKL